MDAGGLQIRFHLVIPVYAGRIGIHRRKQRITLGVNYAL